MNTCLVVVGCVIYIGFIVALIMLSKTKRRSDPESSVSSGNNNSQNDDGDWFGYGGDGSRYGRS